MHNWENVRVEELICEFDFLFVLNPSLFQSSFGCHCFDTRAWPVMHHTPPHTFNLFICLRINSRVNSGMPYTTSKHRTSDPEHTGWGGALCSQTQSPSPGRDPWDLRGGGGVGFYFTTLFGSRADDSIHMECYCFLSLLHWGVPVLLSPVWKSDCPIRTSTHPRDCPRPRGCGDWP